MNEIKMQDEMGASVASQSPSSPIDQEAVKAARRIVADADACVAPATNADVMLAFDNEAILIARALVATAERERVLREALAKTLDAMETQERREAGELHLTHTAFGRLWNGAKKAARAWLTSTAAKEQSDG